MADAHTEMLRDKNPFQAEIIDLIRKHHPLAFNGDGKNCGAVLGGLSNAIGMMLAGVYIQHGPATGNPATMYAVRKILEGTKHIGDETIQALRKKVNGDL